MGGSLRHLIIGLVLASAVVLLGPVAGEAGSGDVTCTGTQSTDVLHNLIVPPSTSCTISPDTMIGNDVLVGAGATLISDGAFIGHNIKATGAACIQIRGNVGGQPELGTPTVGNDVLLTGTGGTCSSPPNRVCDAVIGHDLLIQNSTAAAEWEVGQQALSDSNCGNVVGHDLTVKGNAGGVDVSDNTVTHNLTVTNNTGGTTVDDNTVGTDAKCSGNTGFSGTGNTAGHVNTCNGGI